MPDSHPPRARGAASLAAFRFWSRWAAGFIAVPALFLLLARSFSACDEAGSRTIERMRALSDARRIARALGQHRDVRHQLPDPQDGLAALVPAHLDRLPRDPWNRPYRYVLSHDRLWADVVSYGADGRPGGSGADADVSARFGALGTRGSELFQRFGELGLLVFMLLAFAAARRFAWAAGALAGIAALFAAILTTIVVPPFESVRALLAHGLALASLTGTVALLRGLPGARALALLSAAGAYLLLEALIAG